MFNLKSTIAHTFCALALALSSLAANATVIPAYHVTVDTNAFAGQSGFLDLSFANPGASNTATISNFAGVFGAIDASVSTAYLQPSAGVFTMTGQPGGYLSHTVGMGGLFSFDVAFAGDFTSVAGAFASDFVVYLFDANSDGLGSPDGKVLALRVNQLSNLGDANVSFIPVVATIGTAAAVAANAVPEPADWLLTLTGLVFVVYMTRLNGRSAARRRAAAA